MSQPDQPIVLRVVSFTDWAQSFWMFLGCGAFLQLSSVGSARTMVTWKIIPLIWAYAKNPDIPEFVSENLQETPSLIDLIGGKRYCSAEFPSNQPIERTEDDVDLLISWLVDRSDRGSQINWNMKIQQPLWMNWLLMIQSHLSMFKSI
jgi:hypothetical protein